MTPRFKNATDRLIQAYLKGEIISGQCRSCACFHICQTDDFSDAFCTNSDGYQTRDFEDITINESTIRKIESCGYSLDQLAQVEYLFEVSININYLEIVEAVTLVIDLLASFDTIQSEEVKQLKTFLV